MTYLTPEAITDENEIESAEEQEKKTANRKSAPSIPVFQFIDEDDKNDITRQLHASQAATPSQAAAPSEAATPSEAAFQWFHAASSFRNPNVREMETIRRELFSPGL